MFNKVTPFLATQDIESAIGFYCDVLGFSVNTLDPSDKPTLCVLDKGNVSMMFDATLWQANPPILTGQILFDVNDVDALFCRVQPHAEILWGPDDFDYGRREFSCRDPDGYALVFSQILGDS